MQERNLLIANFVLYQILLIGLAGFQTAVWMFQGLSPAPLLWMVPLLYFGVYRQFLMALAYCYVSSAFLQPFTGASYGYILSLQISVLLLARFFKTRIFWSDFSYHVLICPLFALLTHLMAWAISSTFDANPILKVSLWEIFGSMLLTGIVGPLLISGFLKLDTWMGQEVVLLTGMKMQ